MIKAAYIHIPFCEHICHYCDFNKVFLKGQPVDEYLDSLAEEIKMTLNETPTELLDTIFIGGGTPTALNEQQLEKLCQIIKTYLPYSNETEFTFEANPGDLSEEKLRTLYQAGVNRISFGVQTFNEELLKRIGRAHRAKDVFQSIDLAKKTGFENISIDLIYSLPGQTLADFKETLATAFSLDIQHYSGYSLIIEPKTVFYNLMRKGKLLSPGEDVEAEMFEVLMEEMEKRGFKQYEISNFSKPGYESKHNLTYWNNEWYYGFGAGAHSYVNGSRISNHGPLKKYMNSVNERRLPILDRHKVTKVEQMEEEMFLGLRKTAGVSITRFIEKFEENPVALYKNELKALTFRDLIQVTDDQICLTKQGRFLGNEVFQSFLK
ncbi:radical SAM family heme chaperone HemW [Cytobacillus praedii]|uniref:Heme chaperone HemW n=1 Tax=Cytobacillus praedii TaxID=1742358 RepID=A0A4R1B190_9BACI|nr:radical SAM family heme chaperone HemW [Cytobacillus praedii]MED3548926.1 radical SAM family heme chaperone HemW [Cytobacillus praedii]TCJ04227.1 oxygen-independent coproporphyrinogen III oxidase [Cytobacillus praedii]